MVGDVRGSRVVEAELSLEAGVMIDGADENGEDGVRRDRLVPTQFNATALCGPRSGATPTPDLSMTDVASQSIVIGQCYVTSLFSIVICLKREKQTR